MSREIAGKGLRFSLRHAPCAHVCRYCLISETRKGSALPFARFEALVHRFHDWKRAAGHDDLDIGVFVGPSFDYDLDTLAGVARLRARRGGRFEILNLGGADTTSLRDLVQWIGEELAVEPRIEYLSTQPGDVPITYADVSKAARLLGYSPKVPIREGLRRFVSWYRERGEQGERAEGR